MAIEPSHLREYVIVPTLTKLGLYSESAVELLMGTAAQESHLGRYLHQINGPAIGIYQMEPATYRDIYANFLRYKDRLREKVDALRAAVGTIDPSEREMHGNLYLATAMARIHYLRVPTPLPSAGDLWGLAHYWKVNYNSYLGKGTEEEFVQNYNRYCKG